MQDPRIMCSHQRCADGEDQVDRIGRREAPLSTQAVRKGFPLEQLHGQIGGAVIGVAEVVDLDDGRMFQRGGNSGLAEETLLDFFQLVLVEFLGQGHGLDGHGAVDLRVAA